MISNTAFPKKIDYRDSVYRKNSAKKNLGFGTLINLNEVKHAIYQHPHWKGLDSILSKVKRQDKPSQLMKFIGAVFRKKVEPVLDMHYDSYLSSGNIVCADRDEIIRGGTVKFRTNVVIRHTSTRGNVGYARIDAGELFEKKDTTKELFKTLIDNAREESHQKDISQERKKRENRKLWLQKLLVRLMSNKH